MESKALLRSKKIAPVCSLLIRPSWISSVTRRSWWFVLCLVRNPICSLISKLCFLRKALRRVPIKCSTSLLREDRRLMGR